MLPNSAGSLWNTPNRTSTLLALVKVATNNLSYPEDNHKPAEQSTNKKYSVASSTITTEYLHNRLFLSTKILSSPPHYLEIDSFDLSTRIKGDYSKLAGHFSHLSPDKISFLQTSCFDNIVEHQSAFQKIS